MHNFSERHSERELHSEINSSERKPEHYFRNISVVLLQYYGISEG